MTDQAAEPVLVAAPRTASPPSRLHRHAVFYFAALLGFAIPAFWPSYLYPKQLEADYHVHLHGVAMFLWMALLIAQAALIRTDRRPLHRRLGKASYVLAPIIIVSTPLLLHYRLQKGLSAELLYFSWVILSLLFAFAFSWAMAMRHRKRPLLHARYMVCAALALVDPIFARLLYIYFGIEPPLMQAITYALVDVILLWLAYADWRAGRPRVFAGMLAMFVALQAPTFFIFQTAAWKAFLGGFAALPLP